MPTLAPHSESHRYGPRFMNQFDYWANPESGAPDGGRPWILICPMSGYRQGSRHSVRVNNAIHNDFIAYFQDAARATPYEIFVCDVNQVEPRTFIAGEHVTEPPRERTEYFPDNVAAAAKCFQFIRSYPDRWTLGDHAGNLINPDKGVIYGTSAGGTYAMHIGYWPSQPFFTDQDSLHSSIAHQVNIVERYGVRFSSVPAAVVNRNGQVDWVPKASNQYLEAPLLEQFIGVPSGLTAVADRVSDEVYAAVSPIEYVTDSSPPTISIYDDPGTPDTAEPYTNPDDQRQGDNLEAALDAVGVTNELYKDNPVGNDLSTDNLGRIYSFLQTTLGYP